MMAIVTMRRLGIDRIQIRGRGNWIAVQAVMLERRGKCSGCNGKVVLWMAMEWPIEVDD